MAITCDKRDGIGVVTVTGPLTAATIDGFREPLATWLRAEQELKNLILDLAGVELMDSAGLGALMAALKEITARGGDLRIANLQRKLRLLFEITRAYRVFEVFDSVDEAVRSFQ